VSAPDEMPDHRLTKEERLSSRKKLNALFTSGTSFVVYPVRFVWMVTSQDGPFPARAAFSASKRYWKRAVDRNLLKRRMRESYRVQKQILYQSALPPASQIILACLYIADKPSAFDTVNTSMAKGLQKIAKRVPDLSSSIDLN
jgi:ribonuclease P protein component